jgi:hypothetical protein
MGGLDPPTQPASGSELNRIPKRLSIEKIHSPRRRAALGGRVTPGHGEIGMRVNQMQIAKIPCQQGNQQGISADEKTGSAKRRFPV